MRTRSPLERMAPEQEEAEMREVDRLVDVERDERFLDEQEEKEEAGLYSRPDSRL